MTTRTPALRGLTLTVTERCNLSCAYCYVPRESRRSMDDALLDRAVDLLVDAAGSDKLSLTFFGGEPLLEPAKLQRASRRLRARAGGRQLDLAVTTNGTLLTNEALERCQTEGMRLAVSLDGPEAPAERPTRDGADSWPLLRRRLPQLTALEPGGEVTARMTVTPANVDRLAANLRALTRLGFRRIVYLPAFEQSWTPDHLATWSREHERIGTWITGTLGAGGRPPRLPTWQGVEARLAGRAPRRACGAGTRLAAVATDGRLLPCYRFVFAPDAENSRLGTVDDGWTGQEALALFAAITPESLQPEQGRCARCPAADGCTHFCPALGHVLSGDPFAVPEVVCQLMRAQVAAIRPFAAVVPRRRPARQALQRAVAVAAVAVMSAGASGCSSSTRSDDDADVPMGGVCPVQMDADTDANEDDDAGVDADIHSDDADVPMGGVCPVQVDADVTDADIEDADIPMGGLCPVQVDADIEDADVPMGGVCPVSSDADIEDADPDDDPFWPGIC